jgi:hypothetical protein
VFSCCICEGRSITYLIGASHELFSPNLVLAGVGRNGKYNGQAERSLGLYRCLQMHMVVGDRWYDQSCQFPWRTNLVKNVIRPLNELHMNVFTIRSFFFLTKPHMRRFRIMEISKPIKLFEWDSQSVGRYTLMHLCMLDCEFIRFRPFSLFLCWIIDDVFYKNNLKMWYWGIT